MVVRGGYTVYLHEMNNYVQKSLHDIKVNKWILVLSSYGQYHFKDIYRKITHDLEADSKVTVDTVWNELVPLKVSLFAWRLLCNKILTKKDNLNRHEIINNNSFDALKVVERMKMLFLQGDMAQRFEVVEYLLCLS